MKIELEYPYSSDWSNGYVVVNPEGRETLVLYNSNSDRTTTQYARYLLAVHLGRYLTDYEEVDHIDNNKTNNTISNLQVLSRKENLYKESNRKGAKQWVKLLCPVCSTLFTRVKVNTQLMRCFNGRVSCCSRKCATEWKKMRKNFDEEQITDISRSQVIEEFRKHLN